jgi:single-stranded DNA-binding protein
MNIIGKLHAVMETQQVTATFRKREFVVEFSENPMYPQFILFQLVQDRVELISGYNMGDMIDVSFNLRGRQWNSPSGETRFFNSLEAWRINPAQAQVNPEAQAGMGQPTAGAQPTTASPAQPNQPAVDVTQMNDDDDLPF